MRTDRLLIALALVASTVSANAATVCVQNKQTGRYEPKTVSGNPNECAAFNQLAVSLVQPAATQAPASPAAAVAAQGAPGATTAPSAPPAGIGAAGTHATPTAVSPAPAALAGPAAAPAIAPPPAKPVDPARQNRVYHLKFADVTVRLAMRRWLKEVGMQLAYDAPRDFDVPVEGDYSGPISSVLLQLMTSLSQSSYPLRACEYDNRVVLVVHRDVKCPLEDQ